MMCGPDDGALSDFKSMVKKKKVVEKLKASDFERYLQEMTRLEQVLIDEVASNQFSLND